MAGRGWAGDSRVPPACLVQLPGLRQALPAAPVVNGNLPPVSMAAGKINADEVAQEGEETPVASGPMSPRPILAGSGATSPA